MVKEDICFPPTITKNTRISIIAIFTQQCIRGSTQSKQKEIKSIQIEKEEVNYV